MRNVAVKIEVSSLHFLDSQTKPITLQQCLKILLPPICKR